MAPIIELTSKIWLVLTSEERFLQFAQNRPFEFQIIPVYLASFDRASVQNLAGHGRLPISLSDVCGFSEMLHNVTKLSSRVSIFCAGADPKQQVSIAFLLGCHLIMSNGLGFEEAYLSFKPLYGPIDRYFGNLEFTCSLRALCCAKCLSWIASDSEGETMLYGQMEMDEFMHYSRHTRPTTLSIPMNSPIKILTIN